MTNIIDTVGNLIFRAIYAISLKHSKPRDIYFPHLANVDRITYSFYMPDSHNFTSLDEFIEYKNREPIKKEIVDPNKLNLLTQFVKECSSGWIRYYFIPPVVPKLGINFYSHDSLIETLHLTGSYLCFRLKEGQLFRHLEQEQLNYVLNILDLRSSDLNLT